MIFFFAAAATQLRFFYVLFGLSSGLRLRFYRDCVAAELAEEQTSDE